MRLNNMENVEVEMILADVRTCLGKEVNRILLDEQAEKIYLETLKLIA
ncbi:MAG: hypothetical protein K6A23_08785 [Butyrivibrio sp.]|nr:hypothetical protein [Butyrivibrio sp.]